MSRPADKQLAGADNATVREKEEKTHLSSVVEEVVLQPGKVLDNPVKYYKKL